MPITSSAKKALRGAKKKRVYNLSRKNDYDNAVRALRKSIEMKDIKGAEKQLPTVYKTLDKAVKTKFLKKGTAARYKSRLTLALNKAKK